MCVDIEAPSRIKRDSRVCVLMGQRRRPSPAQIIDAQISEGDKLRPAPIVDTTR